MRHFSDTQIKTASALLLPCYIAVGMAALISVKLQPLVSWVNLFVAIILLLGWMIKQFRIKKFRTESREIIFLSVEAIVVITACIGLKTIITSKWLFATQCLFFGAHFITLLLFLVFMYMAKFKRLL